MQQFTVPQFIDVENKIIGPITTRQFVIMLIAVIIAAAGYKIFDFSAFVALSIFLLIFVAMFGFAKINGRPFYLFVLNVIQTSKKTRLRVWNNTYIEASAIEEKGDVKKDIDIAPPPAKHYTSSRLNELSLVVDTGGAFQGDDLDASARMSSKYYNNN